MVRSLRSRALRGYRTGLDSFPTDPNHPFNQLRELVIGGRVQPARSQITSQPANFAGGLDYAWRLYPSLPVPANEKQISPVPGRCGSAEIRHFHELPSLMVG
jgi:hypothetical protein